MMDELYLLDQKYFKALHCICFDLRSSCPAGLGPAGSAGSAPRACGLDGPTRASAGPTGVKFIQLRSLGILKTKTQQETLKSNKN